MKTFSITLALMCCFTFSFAQSIEAIKLDGSWKIDSVEAPNKYSIKNRYQSYIGQKIHFIDKESIILETTDNYALLNYTSDGNKLKFSGQEFIIEQPTKEHLHIITKKGARKIILVPVSSIEDTILKELMNKSSAQKYIAGIATHSFYQRFNEKRNNYTYLRFFADSTLIKIVSEEPPVDISGKLTSLNFETIQLSYPTDLAYALQSESYLYGKNKTPSYYESYYKVKDGVLHEHLLNYTSTGDTLKNVLSTYKQINTPKPMYWQEKETNPDVPSQKRHLLIPSSVQEIFKILEQMPRFPGCEDKPLHERKECAKELLDEYIQSQLVYPEEAKAAKIEGTVIAQFVVEKDGSISIYSIKDIGYGTAEEAERLVKHLIYDDIIWIPGKQRTRLVRVMYNLPIQFQLK